MHSHVLAVISAPIAGGLESMSLFVIGRNGRCRVFADVCQKPHLSLGSLDGVEVSMMDCSCS